MTRYDQAAFARALFDESGDALFLVDPDTDQLVDVNPVAVRLTGFGRAELLGFPSARLFRAESSVDSQRVRGAVTETVEFHAQDGFYLRCKTTPSGWYPVTLTVSRLHLEAATIGLIVARDDRDRRAALAQARRSEAELRTVLNSSPAALWSAERAPGPDPLAGWQFRYVSDLLAAIAGRPAAVLDTPVRWVEVVHPADREEYKAGVRRFLTGPADAVEQVYRVARPGGGVRWVRDRLRVVRDPAGQPTRLDGCVADITAEREAEEAVRRSERRFRALVEKSRDGLLLLDESGAIRYASPVVRHVLGYDPDEVVGRPVLALTHPDDRPEARTLLAAIADRPGEDVPARVRAVAADGGVRRLEAN
ncbi:MAG TPA: PAS domain S-box protein, partial [Urbifossiella sp.]|nr:PAS domain S-box protein [Urbifossiella sp.]